MEKVYDAHVHYTFDIPLKETVEIFKEEFALTGTEKYIFLSPARASGESHQGSILTAPTTPCVFTIFPHSR